MRPVVLTMTGDGATITNSTPCPVDWRSAPFNIGWAMDTGGSATTFTVQYTLDDPTSFASATAYNTSAHWINVATGGTVDAQGAFTIPCRAIRLQANATGTDTATLTIVQGGGAL